jgi:hypothetical protein
VSNHTTKINDNATEIGKLKTDVATKADKAAYEKTVQDVATNTANIATNLGNINKLSQDKADKTELAAANEVIAQHTTDIA